MSRWRNQEDPTGCQWHLFAIIGTIGALVVGPTWVSGAIGVFRDYPLEGLFMFLIYLPLLAIPVAYIAYLLKCLIEWMGEQNGYSPKQPQRPSPPVMPQDSGDVITDISKMSVEEVGRFYYGKSSPAQVKRRRPAPENRPPRTRVVPSPVKRVVVKEAWYEGSVSDYVSDGRFEKCVRWTVAQGGCNSVTMKNRFRLSWGTVEGFIRLMEGFDVIEPVENGVGHTALLRPEDVDTFFSPGGLDTWIKQRSTADRKTSQADYVERRLRELERQVQTPGQQPPTDITDEPLNEQQD